MKAAKKPTSSKSTRRIARNKTCTQSPITAVAIRESTSSPRVAKNKIWHNWLTEENYL
jgi:hypothetical protein